MSSECIITAVALLAAGWAVVEAALARRARRRLEIEEP